MPTTKLTMKDLSKEQRKALKKADKERRSQKKLSFKWVGRVFARLWPAERYASDTSNDLRYRVLIARRCKNDFHNYSDHRGLVIDLSYDEREDILRVNVNNGGEGETCHTHAHLQVPNVFNAKDVSMDVNPSILRYPWAYHKLSKADKKLMEVKPGELDEEDE